MGQELSPSQVAEVADSAYALRLSRDLLDAAAQAPAARDYFDIEGGTRLVGLTGLGPASRESGFGYVAFGTSARGRQGECLVSIRGTHFPSVHDWLTNARIGVARGPLGYPVHAGFWGLASNLLPQVHGALKDRSSSVVHVVGHSLGGAAATLVAEALHKAGVGEVKVYTYGAPRAGLTTHADGLTRGLGRGNIFRVYHHTDPVPMVPVFPFAHVPCRDPGYLLRGPGTLISVGAHSMGDAYIKSVSGRDWRQLRVLRPPEHSSFEAAEAWLEAAAKSGGGVMMYSASALRLILSALQWILKHAGRALGTALVSGATLLDYLAQLLYSDFLQTLRLAAIIRNLITAILRFTGRVLAKGVEITVAFVKYVLELLVRVIGSVVSRAVNALP